MGMRDRLRSVLTAAAFRPSGFEGSNEATRYVGGTTTGAPTVGDYEAGDFVITQDGSGWVCTATGSPGTWKPLGGPVLWVGPEAPTDGSVFWYDTDATC